MEAEFWEQSGDAGPQRHHDPFDEGAPKPVPVPPEMLAEAMATINEAEIAEEIREIRAGRGRSFDDFIGELDSLVAKLDDAPSTLP